MFTLIQGLPNADRLRSLQNSLPTSLDGIVAKIKALAAGILHALQPYIGKLEHITGTSDLLKIGITLVVIWVVIELIIGILHWATRMLLFAGVFCVLVWLGMHFGVIPNKTTGTPTTVAAPALNATSTAPAAP